VSTFAGFAPAEDPAVSIVVVIDEPSNGVTYASAVAAPVFAEIGAAALRLLEVAPDRIVREGDGRVRADPALAAPDSASDTAGNSASDTAGNSASDTAGTPAGGGAGTAAADSDAASAEEREGEAVALAVDADLARDAGSP
jgi:hypothetical protein